MPVNVVSYTTFRLENILVGKKAEDTFAISFQLTYPTACSRTDKYKYANELLFCQSGSR